MEKLNKNFYKSQQNKVSLFMFNKMLDADSFAKGTIENKKTHLRAFVYYIKERADLSLASSGIERVCDWGRFLAKSGTDLRAIRNYIETARTYISLRREGQSVRTFDILVYYKHEWEAIERMAIKYGAKSAILMTRVKFDRLPLQWQAVATLRGALCCRLDTLENMDECPLVKVKPNRGAAVLNRPKRQPQGDDRSVTVFCNCFEETQDGKVAAQRKRCALHCGEVLPKIKFPIDVTKYRAALKKVECAGHSIGRSAAVIVRKLIAAGDACNDKAKESANAMFEWAGPALTMLYRYSFDAAKYGKHFQIMPLHVGLARMILKKAVLEKYEAAVRKEGPPSFPVRKFL